MLTIGSLLQDVDENRMAYCKNALLIEELACTICELIKEEHCILLISLTLMIPKDSRDMDSCSSVHREMDSSIKFGME
jgi:hypothetical protein